MNAQKVPTVTSLMQDQLPHEQTVIRVGTTADATLWLTKLLQVPPILQSSSQKVVEN